MRLKQVIRMAGTCALAGAIAFALIGSGLESGLSKDASAATPFTNSVTCTDVYFDATPPAVGQPPEPDSLLIGKSLTRQDVAKGWPLDRVQKLYLGWDIPGFEPPQTDPLDFKLGEIIPDGPPTNQTCESKAPSANAQAEPVDELKQKASITSQFRPPGFTEFAVDGSLVSTVSCIFDGKNGWVREETHTDVQNKGAKAINYGQATLFFGTDSPASATDIDGDTKPDAASSPSECTGGFALTATTVVVNREPATDDPTNIDSSVVADPDGTSGTPPPLPQPPDGNDGLADDWDGDGCTDWDELSPNIKVGLDPFNPEDCDQDISGIWNFLASVDKPSKVADPNGEEDGAGPGSCTDTIDNGADGAADLDDADCYMILGGTNFGCIARIDEPSAGVLDANIVCYQDSPGLAGASGSAVPAYADGIAGAPPPPPYTTSEPTKLVGTIAGKSVHLQGCFEELGPPLGPNVLVDISLSLVAGGVLKGTEDIYGMVNNDDCASLNFGGSGLLLISGVPITAAEQVIDFDHDGDGCTDFEELGHLKTPPTVAKCGDDPYNPYDSGLAEMSGSYSLVARVSQTGAAHPNISFGGLPGAYFNCVTEVNHDTDFNTVTAPIYCYTDTVVIAPGTDTIPGTADDEMFGISVNFEDSGLAVCAPVLVGAGPALPALDLNNCGDGNPGANPPGPAGGGSQTWGDVDDPHTVLTGVYDKAENALVLEGCFQNVENPIEGPNIYVKARIDAHVGPSTEPADNTADIWTQRADCTDPGATGQTFDDVPMLSARQSDSTFSFDTDRDGCTNAEELSVPRDPFNHWDFRDVPTGPDLLRDGTVNAFDVAAVLSRYGTAGDPTGDPLSPPPASGYHTAYDTGGAIFGSAGVWNVRGPDGAIAVPDLTAVIVQYGTCMNLSQTSAITFVGKAGPSFVATCTVTYAFVSLPNTFSLTGSCAGDFGTANLDLTGTVDAATGAFSFSGTLGQDSFELSGTGDPDGNISNGVWTNNTTGSSGNFSSGFIENSVTETISVSGGGTVELSGGGGVVASLVIGPGSITVPGLGPSSGGDKVDITIQQWAVAAAPDLVEFLPHVPPNPNLVLVDVVNIEPSGATLDPPAELTLPFQGSDIEGVVHFNGQEWEWLPIQTVGEDFVTVLVDSFSPDGIPLGDPDYDQDGCSNLSEQQTAPGSEATGGLRDPLDFWDFMDVWVGSPSPVRDKVVSVGDISAVVNRFGAASVPPPPPPPDETGVLAQVLTSSPAPPEYHPDHDRGGSDPAQNLWNLRPADGGIAVGDIKAAVDQFGHSCAP